MKTLLEKLMNIQFIFAHPAEHKGQTTAKAGKKKRKSSGYSGKVYSPESMQSRSGIRKQGNPHP
jgi:hypothetical protein